MSAPTVRVLWLAKGLGRGGAEQLLVSLARTLCGTGLEIHVGYVLPHKDALVPDLAATGATVHCLTRPGAPWPVTLRRLLRAEERFDVVHTHSPLVASVARLVAPAGTTLLHTEHNLWARYRWPTRLANAATLRRNSTVWAVSEGVARSMHLGPLLQGLEVEVMVHGLGPDHRPTGPAARLAGLARLGLEPGPFTIGSVGNLTPKKDYDTLVFALERLRREVPGARLVLVGAGPEEAQLRELVAARGLTGHVLLAGVRDDVPTLLPAFDVFALSSRYEGLSIALLEAMAAGVAPVATRVGGIPEVIRDGTDGLLVPPGEPGLLARALAELAREPSRRRRLGAAAASRAACFGIDRAAATLLATYGCAGPRHRAVAS